MLIKRPSVLEGLHGRSSLAVFSLIGSLVIVILHEVAEVRLDFLDGFVEFFSESGLIELVLDGLIETLGGAIVCGWRTFVRECSMPAQKEH